MKSIALILVVLALILVVSSSVSTLVACIGEDDSVEKELTEMRATVSASVANLEAVHRRVEAIDQRVVEPGLPPIPGPQGAVSTPSVSRHEHIKLVDAGFATPASAVWRQKGTAVIVYGSGFKVDETISLTVQGYDSDDALGSAVSSKSGAFATEVILDAFAYPVGTVLYIVATGDLGSRFSAPIEITESR